MSYDVGTHINLSHLNEAEVQSAAPSLLETTSNFMDVGTQISFRIINDKFKAVRRIPVAFA